MTRPLLLDLFCGAGGAAMGYWRVGFDVVGVDIAPQPDYPFTFYKADALKPSTWPLWLFDRVPDAIHASPPCQGYTTMSNRHGSRSPLLIDDARQMVSRMTQFWVIENVVGARRHMRNPLMLHGGMFGLNVYRPRLFESNVLIMAPAPVSPPKNAAAVYGKNDQRRVWTRSDGTELRAASLAEAQAAMGMDWADWHGTKEAIPPAYTEFIGAQLLQHVKAAA